MDTIPETYRESNFEDELRDLLRLAQDAAEAACNANACGTRHDSDKARTLDHRLDEHHECFLAKWERLATQAAMDL
jgi:hypothetical protein